MRHLVTSLFNCSHPVDDHPSQPHLLRHPTSGWQHTVLRKGREPVASHTVRHVQKHGAGTHASREATGRDSRGRNGRRTVPGRVVFVSLYYVFLYYAEYVSTDADSYSDPFPIVFV